MLEKKLFITTTLPYISGEKGAHVGHCFEFVLADVIARYYRIKLGGSNVFFNTGIDEHGQKIYQRAIELGKQPQEYCDEKAEVWKDFCQQFKISYDNFYRTTSPLHKLQAQEYFDLLLKNSDDVYLGSYSGKYCDGCEAIKTEKDLVDGKCQDHPTLVPKQITEENYFFNLKKYAINCVPKDILVDDTLYNELNYIVEHAEDMPISRQNVSWAIPVRNSTHTIYVWKEALQSYIYAAGYNFQKEEDLEEFKSWWNNSLIICGKDNLRFQALILPAILAANNISSPKKVFVHGTIQDANGAKMSKTTGNVIDPIDQLEKFGLNPVRYYLVAGLNSFGNSSYSEDELIQKYNNEVVNGYGNLLSRALHLIDIKKIPIDENLLSEKELIDAMLDQIQMHFESFNLRIAYSEAAKVIIWANKYITEERPFSADCMNPEIILNNVYYLLKNISMYYQIVLPDSAEAIGKAIEEKKKAILFTKIELQNSLS